MLAALGKAGGELGALGTDLFGVRTSSDLFVGLVHSRTVQDRLVNQFDLRKVYGVSRWDSARKTLENRTDVSSDRKSGIITIAVSDHSPQRAADMAHEYVASLDRVVVTLNISSAHKERTFLEQRLVQVQQDLETSEKDFGDFASKNTAIDVKEQGKAMIGAAAEVEGQMIAAQTELEGLRQIYTSNNVRVRALQARIDELRRQFQKLGGKSETYGETVPATDDQYPSIRQLPILGVTYADLFRRAKVQEVIFETLTKQYEMAKVEEARETPSVKVLDEGEVPEGKSYPPRYLFMSLGTMFCCIAGAFWILARERWQRLDSQDPRKVLVQEMFQTAETKVSGIANRVGHKLGRSREENSLDRS
jgi:capsule polysaccharide export protein KpsE/RkpR